MGLGKHILLFSFVPKDRRQTFALSKTSMFTETGKKKNRGKGRRRISPGRSHLQELFFVPLERWAKKKAYAVKNKILVSTLDKQKK